MNRARGAAQKVSNAIKRKARCQQPLNYGVPIDLHPTILAAFTDVNPTFRAKYLSQLRARVRINSSCIRANSCLSFVLPTCNRHSPN